MVFLVRNGLIQSNELVMLWQSLWVHTPGRCVLQWVLFQHTHIPLSQRVSKTLNCTTCLGPFQGPPLGCRFLIRPQLVPAGASRAPIRRSEPRLVPDMEHMTYGSFWADTCWSPTADISAGHDPAPI